MRKASVKRTTKETAVEVAVALDGEGRASVATGIGFLDHMLDLLARHSQIDIEVKAKGDLHIDHHHTTRMSVPPTGDWLVPLGEGHLRLDVRGTIKTDDGELILFEYYGVLSFPKEAFDRALKGEVVTAKDGYFITAPIFTTASKKYAWLTQIQAVGKMTSVKVGKFVKYDILKQASAVSESDHEFELRRLLHRRSAGTFRSLR